MSVPQQPAFIRTAPPTEPGMPTMNSRPPLPCAAVPLAKTGLRKRGAGHGHPFVVDREPAEADAEVDDDAVEPAVGRRRRCCPAPAPAPERGRRRIAAPRSMRSCSLSASRNQRAGPPTL